MIAKAKPSAPPHAFEPDGIPPGHDGRGTCARCHKVGEAGDAQHPEPGPLPPAPPEQQLMDARYDPEALDA